MVEVEVMIPGNNVSLSGTLCLPQDKGTFPVVLMIHGSGDIDRDENTKSQKLNIFNSIAHHLANNGIASLRYDKRGIGSSTGNFYSTGHFDLIEDAKSCLEYLLENKQCDNESVYLLGHSEGTVIAPRLSLNNNRVAGIILLAPFTENLETIMLKQANTITISARDLSGYMSYFYRLLFWLFNPIKTQKKIIKKIHESKKPYIFAMFEKIPAKWARELMSVNPIDIYNAVICPSLIIGGSKDLQCEPEAVRIIESLTKGPTESHIIENMTHILRQEPGTPSLFNYPKLLKEPINTDMLNLITSWIHKITARPND